MSNNRSENPKVFPVVLSEESLKTDRTHWYRGDKREPSRIFEEGFKARGDNSNLIEHVHGNASGPIKDSAYISTSIFEDAASRYPKDFIALESPKFSSKITQKLTSENRENKNSDPLNLM